MAELSLDGVKDTETLLVGPHLSGLVHGNFDRNGAESIGSLLKDGVGLLEVGFSTQRLTLTLTLTPALKLEADPGHVPGSPRTVSLPFPSTQTFSAMHSNPEEENSATLALYQIGSRCPANNVIVDLLVSALKASFFEEIRTHRQLGYAVGLHKMSYGESLWIALQVQSIKASAEALDWHLENYVEEHARGLLSRLTRDEFQGLLDAEIAKRCEVPTTSSEDASAIYREVMRRDKRLFDRQAQEVSLLRQLQQKDLGAFFRDYLSPEGPRTARLSVRVQGSSTSGELTADQRFVYASPFDIGQVSDFKASSIYGVPPPTHGGLSMT